MTAPSTGERPSIDPLIHRSGTAATPHPPEPKSFRAAHPYPTRRALRIAGAAGMTSLMAMTGYVTAGAGGSSSKGGVSEVTSDDVAASVAAPSTTVAVATPTEPTASTSVPAAVCTTTYSVVAGDSWYLIADEASLPVDEVYAANNANANTALFPGQAVCLPEGAVVVTTTAPAPAAPATVAKVTVAAPVAQPAAAAPTPTTTSKSS